MNRTKSIEKQLKTSKARSKRIKHAKQITRAKQKAEKQQRLSEKPYNIHAAIRENHFATLRLMKTLWDTLTANTLAVPEGNLTPPWTR